MSLFGVETGVPLKHHAFGTELLVIRIHNAELFPFSDVLTKFLQKAFGSNSWVVKNLKIKLLLYVVNRQPLGFLDGVYGSMHMLYC